MAVAMHISMSPNLTNSLLYYPQYRASELVKVLKLVSKSITNPHEPRMFPLTGDNSKT